MSDAVGLRDSKTTWEIPPVKPLDEAVWQTWQAKGLAQDRRDRETRLKALKWFLIVALLAVTGLWSQLTSYEPVIKWVLAAGAVGLLFDAFNRRHYALAAVFAVLALLYNPVVPMFSLSGNWQRALVLVSAVPIFASLAWRNTKAAHID